MGPEAGILVGDQAMLDDAGGQQFHLVQRRAMVGIFDDTTSPCSEAKPLVMEPAVAPMARRGRCRG
jgi:hypothetical protein